MISRTEGTGTTQYVWDFENRLTQVVTPASGSVTYKYDGLGRRIQRTPSSGVSTNFVYDGQDVVKDINSDGTAVEYLNGPGIDNKFRQKGSSTSTTYYFSQDHLGSTTALTGTTGKLVERITYDGYGNTAGSTRTRYGYTGRERDPMSGLLYYRARWYDPQIGRFISEDPIGLHGEPNAYAYADQNPIGIVDPFGLFGKIVVASRTRSYRWVYDDAIGRILLGDDPTRLALDYAHDRVSHIEDFRVMRVTRIESDVTTARICYSAENTGTGPSGWPIGHAPGDDRGHIISQELGGSGENYWTFGQNRRMNQHGRWRAFEREIRIRIDTGQDQCLCADVRIELFHTDNSPLRPTRIQYDVSFTDGTGMHESFDNP